MTSRDAMNLDESPIPSFDLTYKQGKDAARRIAALSTPTVRLPVARSFCATVIRGYWTALCARYDCRWQAPDAPEADYPLSEDTMAIASAITRSVAPRSTIEAGFMIGGIYTLMLPDHIRVELGAHYTPPTFSQRLINLSEKAGADWSSCTVMDPACGGGAFLAPAALRMLEYYTSGEPTTTLADLAKRLRGIEIDPFAAWMSQCFLEATLLPLCIAARRRFPSIITVGDALDSDTHSKYDLVIGNPPYGRTRLTETRRREYARSLFGHANLYGLFTDLALRLSKPDGVVAFVTPTSFLGGEYFKHLRALLLKEAPPFAIDFITDREGIFDGVLQETLLAAFRRKAVKGIQVCSIRPEPSGNLVVEKVSTVSSLPEQGPWLLPRSKAQANLLGTVQSMPHRLANYGYCVSTGPLVWNRHRPQLRNTPGLDVFPLIWAESVSAAGFAYRAATREHTPYIEVFLEQPHLITRAPCVLVQRTTAKEQQRRLIAAVMPASFLSKHGGAVVENHLNMICSKLPKVPPETIAALLNTQTVDSVFRLISGSVAVSAYELEALPLPAPDQLTQLTHMLKKSNDPAEIETTVAHFYNVRIDQLSDGKQVRSRARYDQTTVANHLS